MIKYYLDFLNESKGISNVIKKYVDDDLINYFDGNNKTFFIDLNDSKLPIKNLNISIKYKEEYNYDGLFNPKNFMLKDSILFDIYLDFKIPINYDIVRIKSLISHELTHILEFYNLVKNNKNIPKHGKLKIELNKFKNNNYENYFDAFLHYIYLTLDNEFNARVSELFFYLKSKNIDDKDKLIELVKNSYIWKKIIEIEMFEHIRFGDFLINKLGIESVIVFLNKFNESLPTTLKFTSVIKNKNDIYHYFNKWEKIFKKKNKKHKKKCLNIINEL